MIRADLHRGALRRAGFTLIEMMAVMLLLALIAAMALPAFGRGSGADAENDARELAAGIESARRAALTERIAYRLVVDLRAGAWWLEREARDPDAAEDLAPGELPTWADLEELPLAAPTASERRFENVPGLIGGGNVLRETVHFAGAETTEGFVGDGMLRVLLRPDGIADPTVLVLETEEGVRTALHIEALDEVVGVKHEG